MLFRKLLRTIGVYKAQFISMIIMVALGIGVFTGFNMEWYSIEKNTAEIYEKTNFADYRIISEEGFSEDDLKVIKNIDGVKDAARFLSINAAVKSDAEEDSLAVTVNENMNVSGMLIFDGDEYDRNSKDGIWLSDKYAAANDIKVGDSMTLVYKNKDIKCIVRALVKASEYMVCLPDNQVMPDYSTYGFAFVSPALIEKEIGFVFYPQINVISDLEKSEFTENAEKVLERTVPILSKDEVVSWAEVKGEVEEGQTMGNVLPVLFLAIAILTMVTTMNRIAASEKTQIGTLKALGFKDRRIIMHYSSYALFIGLLGTAFGIGIGYFVGRLIMDPEGAMGSYIDIPSWKLYMPGFCWSVMVAIVLFMTFIGFLSVKNMLKGTAADALRPYSPKKMKQGLISKTSLWKNKLGFGTKWNLRDCGRHKARTGMTLFGIVGCMILLVGALGMNDTVNKYIEAFYEKQMNYTMKINIDEAGTENEDAAEIAEKYSGDWVAQASVQITDKPVVTEVYSLKNDKVRLLNQDMEPMKPGNDGVYICSRIAGDYNLKEGDTFAVSPYGTSDEYTFKVAGIVYSMGESIAMTKDYAEKAGYPYHISSVFTDETDIETSKFITNTQSKKSIIDSFDAFMDVMNTMIILLCVAAVILGTVVLYNLGVMSYTERYREMATLKVLGFKDKKIGSLLISQNMWITVVGVILGIPCGIGVLKYLLDALASEYEMKLCVGPLTYLISTVLTFGVSLFVGLIISKKNKHINMVEALKGTE